MSGSLSLVFVWRQQFAFSFSAPLFHFLITATKGPTLTWFINILMDICPCCLWNCTTLYLLKSLAITVRRSFSTIRFHDRPYGVLIKSPPSTKFCIITKHGRGRLIMCWRACGTAPEKQSAYRVKTCFTGFDFLMHLWVPFSCGCRGYCPGNYLSRYIDTIPLLSRRFCLDCST